MKNFELIISYKYLLDGKTLWHADEREKFQADDMEKALIYSNGFFVRWKLFNSNKNVWRVETREQC